MCNEDDIKYDYSETIVEFLEKPFLYKKMKKYVYSLSIITIIELILLIFK